MVADPPRVSVGRAPVHIDAGVSADRELPRLPVQHRQALHLQIGHGSGVVGDDVGGVVVRQEHCFVSIERGDLDPHLEDLGGVLAVGRLRLRVDDRHVDDPALPLGRQRARTTTPGCAESGTSVDSGSVTSRSTDPPAFTRCHTSRGTPASVTSVADSPCT